MYKMKDGRVVLTPAQAEAVTKVFTHSVNLVDILEAAQNTEQPYEEVRLLRALQECQDLGVSTERFQALTVPVLEG